MQQVELSRVWGTTLFSKKNCMSQLLISFIYLLPCIKQRTSFGFFEGMDKSIELDQLGVRVGVEGVQFFCDIFSVS